MLKQAGAEAEARARSPDRFQQPFGTPVFLSRERGHFADPLWLSELSGEEAEEGLRLWEDEGSGIEWDSYLERLALEKTLHRERGDGVVGEAVDEIGEGSGRELRESFDLLNPIRLTELPEQEIEEGSRRWTEEGSGNKWQDHMERLALEKILHRERGDGVRYRDAVGRLVRGDGSLVGDGE